MVNKVEHQLVRVSLLTDFVDEELANYLEKYRDLEEWKKINGENEWRNRPSLPPKSFLMDRMKLLRQETIKLDKLLNEEIRGY